MWSFQIWLLFFHKFKLEFFLPTLWKFTILFDRHHVNEKFYFYCFGTSEKSVNQRKKKCGLMLCKNFILCKNFKLLIRGRHNNYPFATITASTSMTSGSDPCSKLRTITCHLVSSSEDKGETFSTKVLNWKEQNKNNLSSYRRFHELEFYVTFTPGSERSQFNRLQIK